MSLLKQEPSLPAGKGLNAELYDEFRRRFLGLDKALKTCVVSIPWSALSVNGIHFVAPYSAHVIDVVARVNVPGTDVGAVTAQIRLCDDGEALTSGDVPHLSTINLKGAANTAQVLSLSNTVTIHQGGAIGITFAGVLTAATGVVSVRLMPIKDI